MLTAIILLIDNSKIYDHCVRMWSSFSQKLRKGKF